MMTIKIILVSLVLMVFVMMALGIKLLFNRNSGAAISSCCTQKDESSCACTSRTDRPIK